jgi:hypothetical protein
MAAAEIYFEFLNQSHADGTYRLPDRSWEVFMIDSLITVPDVRRTTWDSGATGFRILVPDQRLNRGVVARLLSEALGVHEWKDAVGPNPRRLTHRPVPLADPHPIARMPEISFDLVMYDQMEFIEGTYRLPGSGWEVCVFCKKDVTAPSVKVGARWPSGITGTYVEFPEMLNRTTAVRLMSGAHGVSEWHEVRGPDSMQLR